jgi:hypothetical protein
MWYAAGRGPGRHDDRPYPVPDLAREVRSASTWRYDIGAKKAAYERARLPELWLVDTAADVVLVFRRSTPKIETFDVSPAGPSHEPSVRARRPSANCGASRNEPRIAGAYLSCGTRHGAGSGASRRA